MKDNTILIAQNLYLEIRDSLTPEQRDTYKHIIDCLTWTPYKRELVYDFCGTYLITLVDGTEFPDTTFRFDSENKYFYTTQNIKHPQVIFDGEFYTIKDDVVKYIK